MITLYVWTFQFDFFPGNLENRVSISIKLNPEYLIKNPYLFWIRSVKSPELHCKEKYWTLYLNFNKTNHNRNILPKNCIRKLGRNSVVSIVQNILFIHFDEQFYYWKYGNVKKQNKFNVVFQTICSEKMLVMSEVNVKYNHLLLHSWFRFYNCTPINWFRP